MRCLSVSTVLNTLLLCLNHLAVAQTTTTVTHGAVVVVRTGDRQPTLDKYPGDLKLSSMGSNQSYAVGNFYRSRYYPSLSDNSDTSTGIYALPFLYDSAFVSVLAGDNPYLVSSAQAFMQGLYPPQIQTQDNTPPSFYEILYTSNNDNNILQNPLGGYQYPYIQAPGDNDDHSIYIDGSNLCFAFRDARADYFSSDDFNQIRANSRGFYEEISSGLSDSVMQFDDFDFSNAYKLAEYFQYQYVHNETVFNKLTQGPLADINTLARLQWLSDQWTFGVYGSPKIYETASYNPVATIAGQTMAGHVWDQLSYNKNSEGNSSKLSLMFTDFEPFIGFFELSGLAGLNEDFLGMPLFGSSMAFELYSVQDSSEIATSDIWPSEDELRVRFIFRNGSVGGQELPLFGEQETSMTWAAFEQHMSKASMDSYETWCETCNSQYATTFCTASNISAANNMMYGNDGEGDGDSSSSPSSSYTLSTKTAGVLGAAATLVVLGIFLVLLVSCFGVRFTRIQPERKENLGGFRGTQKLASDPDLTSKKNGIFVSETEPKPRVGSWELKDGQGPQRPDNYRNPPIEDEDHYHHIGASIHPVERV